MDINRKKNENCTDAIIGNDPDVMSAAKSCVDKTRTYAKLSLLTDA